MPHIIVFDLKSTKFNHFKDVVLEQQNSTKIYDNQHYYTKALKFALAQALTQEALYALQQMSQGHEPGVIHFKNLPQDENLSVADSVLARNINKTRMSESLILAMAALTGCYLYAKPSEQNGTMVHNISPIPGKEGIISSIGRDPFYYHTEIAYSPDVPLFLMLYCLEADSEAKTSYFPIQQLLAKIPEDIKETMRKPIFELSAVVGYDEESVITPLLYANPMTGREVFRFYQNIDRIQPKPRTENESIEVDVCLNFLKQHAGAMFPKAGHEPSIALQAGEALIFNNGWRNLAKDMHNGVMHGRVGYIRNPNRWLQRSYFFPTNPQIDAQINEGYYHFLFEMITNKRTSLLLAVSQLKITIKNTNSYKELKATKPNFNEAQLFFHSVQPDCKLKKQHWLRNLATNAELDSVSPQKSSSKL